MNARHQKAKKVILPVINYIVFLSVQHALHDRFQKISMKRLKNSPKNEKKNKATTKDQMHSIINC